MKYITAKQFAEKARCLTCGFELSANKRNALCDCKPRKSEVYSYLSFGKRQTTIYQYAIHFNMKYLIKACFSAGKVYSPNYFNVYEVGSNKAILNSTRIPAFVIGSEQEFLDGIEKIKTLDVFK